MPPPGTLSTLPPQPASSRHVAADEDDAARVLIVEDDVPTAARLERALQQNHYEVTVVGTARQAEAVLRDRAPAVVLLDLSLPDSSDLSLFHRIRAAVPRTRVVIMTALDDLDVVISATRAGAFDFITKGPDVLQRVLVTVRNATEMLQREDQVAALSSSLARHGRFPRMIAQSPAMDEVKVAIDKLATSRVNVLITGQSGTGKEVVARSIHETGPRQGQPFVAVNCAGIPDTLLESELFGYERGAFTGAAQRKIGKFESAHGGTLFLDEIGEMSLTLQAKLLRVLQDGRFERLGGNVEVHTDTRVVCATNRDLPQMVKRGQFREDLYYRIAVFSLHVPPLSDRKEDVAILANHFLRQSARDEGKSIAEIAPEVMRLLEMHYWPGNVRQLQNVVARAAVVCNSHVLALRDLPESFVQELNTSMRHASSQPHAVDTQPGPESQAVPVPQVRAGGFGFLSADQMDRLRHGSVQDRLDVALGLAFPGDEGVPTIEDLEGAGVRLALRRLNGSMQAAADHLGISRATLYRRAAKGSIAGLLESRMLAEQRGD